MEPIVCNVRDLDQADRSALERVVGHELRASQRLVIQVMPLPVEETPKEPLGPGGLPDWCNIYQGLSDPEIDELDRAITRAQSSREFS